MRKIITLFLFYVVSSVVFAGPFGLPDLGTTFESRTDEYNYEEICNLEANLGGYTMYSAFFYGLQNEYFEEAFIIVDNQGLIVNIQAYSSSEFSDDEVFDTMDEALRYAYGTPTSAEYVRDLGFFEVFLLELNGTAFDKVEWRMPSGVRVRLEETYDSGVHIEYSTSRYDEYVQYELPSLEEAYRIAEEQRARAAEEQQRLEKEAAHQSMIQGMSL